MNSPRTTRVKLAELLLWIAWRQRRYRRSDLAMSIEREYIVPAGNVSGQGRSPKGSDNGH